MNILSRTCNARQGNVIEKSARQNVPIWNRCDSKPSHHSQGPDTLPFIPAQEEIQAHFLSPFNITLKKSLLGSEAHFAALPLRNFEIQNRVSLDFTFN